MKLILQIFAFLLFLGVIYIVVLNGSETLTLNVFPPQYDEVAQVVRHATKSFSVPFYTLSILCAGLLAGLFLFVPFYLTQTEQLYAYKRELEKSSIKTDNSSSQVKVLQAKVNVLEKALKDALSKQD